MKVKVFCTLILSICVSITSMNLCAQEYQKSPQSLKYDGYNVNQLNLALAKSLKTIKTGKTLTFIGLGATTLGGILFAASLDMDGSWEDFAIGMNRSIGGVLLMNAGAISTAVGIPIWIVGASNKNKIEISLAKFGPVSSVNGVGIKIRF